MQLIIKVQNTEDLYSLKLHSFKLTYSDDLLSTIRVQNCLTSCFIQCSAIFATHQRLYIWKTSMIVVLL